MTSPWVAACCTQAICSIAPTGGDVLITNADLQADDWVSGTTAWGILQNGSADFRSITADEMVVDRFISDINLALAGTEIITKSLATISRDFTVSASATLHVYDLPGAPDTAVFENGDCAAAPLRPRLWTDC